jgi:hypothetical protein
MRNLTWWLRMHRYVQPAELADGESGMALLILWEVDHQRDFPMRGGEDSKLRSFTRRLKRRVAMDPELSQWLESKPMQKPLAPGLADMHGQETRRGGTRSSWRDYLVTQSQPYYLNRAAVGRLAAAPTAPPDVASSSRVDIAASQAAAGPPAAKCGDNESSAAPEDPGATGDTTGLSYLFFLKSISFFLFIKMFLSAFFPILFLMFWLSLS